MNIQEYEKLFNFLENRKNKDIKREQEMEDEVTQLRKEREELKQQNQQLDTERTEFQEKFTALQSDHRELRQQKQLLDEINTRIQADNNALQNEKKKLESENMILNREKKKRQVTIDTLNQGTKRLLDENNNLNQKIEQLNASANSTSRKQENNLFSPWYDTKAQQPKIIGRDIHTPVIVAFNNWASNPRPQIPPAFGYLEGEFRIRSIQLMKPSHHPTKWITNNTGTKYLFPNPNFFDERTDISELYQMDLSQLRPPGSNKIKIVKACEISDTGWIKSRGELQIL